MLSPTLTFPSTPSQLLNDFFLAHKHSYKIASAGKKYDISNSSPSVSRYSWVNWMGRRHWKSDALFEARDSLTQSKSDLFPSASHNQSKGQGHSSSHATRLIHFHLFAPQPFANKSLLSPTNFEKYASNRYTFWGNITNLYTSTLYLGIYLQAETLLNIQPP